MEPTLFNVYNETIFMVNGEERVVFPVISPTLWRRYGDDILVIIDEDNLFPFHHLLSTTLPGLSSRKSQ